LPDLTLNLCVLCTCAGNDSRATPVWYRTDGFTVVISSESSTKKFDYLKKNRNVAIALHSTRAPIKGRETEREVKTIRELSRF